MKIVIAGAGGYGQVYLSYLQANPDFEVAGFLDDDPAKEGQKVAGVPVLGTTSDFESARRAGASGVMAPIGNNTARVNILGNARESGLKTPNFIHPSVVISEDSPLRENQGVYILGGAMIMPFVSFEDFVMVSGGTNIAHHITLGSGAFISMGANIGAGIALGERVFVGIGSTIMTGVKIVGRDAMIGAGAVVINDVPEGATMIGVPARALPKK